MRHTLGVSNWLQKLGVKGGDIPDVVPLIQPVQVVSDASALSAPLLAPVAWAGGSVAAVALEYGSLSVQALAPGGVWVRYCGVSTGAAVAEPWWTVVAADPFAADALATTATRRDMSEDPTTSIVKIGTSTATLSTDNPLVSGNGRTFHELPDLIYVRPGYWFACQLKQLNVLTNWAVCIQDVPDFNRGES